MFQHIIYFAILLTRLKMYVIFKLKIQTTLSTNYLYNDENINTRCFLQKPAINLFKNIHLNPT